MEAVIFIGIQATGKSTFYTQRFAETHVRISLDMLKTRPREERLLLQCIRERKPFVVDNTNVLVRERSRYISAAKGAGYMVIGYYFETDLADALERNNQREGKAAIPWKGVVAKFRAMQRPRYAEGFDRLFLVRIGAGGEFVVRDWQEDPPEPKEHH